MKNIFLSLKGFEKNTIFTNKNVDDLNGSWKYLKQKMADNGYDLKTVDDNPINDAERLLFVDEVTLGNKRKNDSKIKSLLKKLLGKKSIYQQERPVYNEACALGLKDKMVLILWEPRTIDPENYTKETYDKFSTILTWNDDLVDDKKFFKFFHPYSDKERIKPSIKFNDKKFLVNISINKISSHPNELYSMRKKSISFFEKKFGEQFDLFGYNWNQPITRLEKIFPFLVKKYASYKGVCGSKHEVLSNYKFSLCYENIKNEKGWITEKIFDCFHARTIPIYWGADNVTDYIPKETFIDRRNFKNDKELLFFIQKIEEKEYNRYMEAIDLFLISDDYKKFLPENFFKLITKALKL